MKTIKLGATVMVRKDWIGTLMEIHLATRTALVRDAEGSWVVELDELTAI